MILWHVLSQFIKFVSGDLKYFPHVTHSVMTDDIKLWTLFTSYYTISCYNEIEWISTYYILRES